MNSVLHHSVPIQKKQLFHYFNAHYNSLFYFDSNEFTDTKFNLSKFDCLFAGGVADEITANANSLEKLQAFIDKHKGKWMAGFISYDVKNEIENIKSTNEYKVQFPSLHFIVPQTVVKIKGDEQLVYNYGNADYEITGSEKYFVANECEILFGGVSGLKPKIDKEKYLQKIEAIKKHIQLGNIYEMTFCNEFFAEDIIINPEKVFWKLQSLSPAPFSCYVKTGDKYLISSSPERYLCKRGNKLYSQPIKGTVKRGNNAVEDEQLKHQLLNSEKERAENVMIVDLVRNDLSRIAKQSSVNVEELFGIYSFSTVHQMISTISCTLTDQTSFTDIIHATFPMGSMTGAPKIKAMQLINEFEETRRGLFSGTVGYIDPQGDFDFNVVIRSILYNEEKKFISVQTGGAITVNSLAEQELEEILLKLKAMKEALQ